MLAFGLPAVLTAVAFAVDVSTLMRAKVSLQNALDAREPCIFASRRHRGFAQGRLRPLLPDQCRRPQRVEERRSDAYRGKGPQLHPDKGCRHGGRQFELRLPVRQRQAHHRRCRRRRIDQSARSRASARQYRVDGQQRSHRRIADGGDGPDRYARSGEVADAQRTCRGGAVRHRRQRQGRGLRSGLDRHGRQIAEQWRQFPLGRRQARQPYGPVQAIGRRMERLRRSAARNQQCFRHFARPKQTGHPVRTLFRAGRSR
ncbi:Tad domain-containing protein [Mesorhizobium sp. M0816]|uniref:Tad domain-containing protein n=1 Tax=Mesorhizobium sp. M0816 TaxID=2957006 RepID=UPI00333A086D